MWLGDQPMSSIITATDGRVLFNEEMAADLCAIELTRDLGAATGLVQSYETNVAPPTP